MVLAFKASIPVLSTTSCCVQSGRKRLSKQKAYSRTQNISGFWRYLSPAVPWSKQGTPEFPREFKKLVSRHVTNREDSSISKASASFTEIDWKKTIAWVYCQCSAKVDFRGPCLMMKRETLFGECISVLESQSESREVVSWTGIADFTLENGGLLLFLFILFLTEVDYFRYSSDSFPERTDLCKTRKHLRFYRVDGCFVEPESRLVVAKGAFLEELQGGSEGCEVCFFGGQCKCSKINDGCTLWIY